MPYTLPLPENSGEVTPRNMGTQCENLEIVESGSENDLTIKRLWLRAVLKVKQYFGFGVRTSDPLLNVVKWIAYITEVLSIIISKETYLGSLQSFFLQIGATVAVTLLLISILICAVLKNLLIPTDLPFFLFVLFLFTFVGLMAFLYVHYMFVKPSRHLLLGLQQVALLAPLRHPIYRYRMCAPSRPMGKQVAPPHKNWQNLWGKVEFNPLKFSKVITRKESMSS